MAESSSKMLDMVFFFDTFQQIIASRLMIVKPANNAHSSVH